MRFRSRRIGKEHVRQADEVRRLFCVIVQQLFNVAFAKHYGNTIRATVDILTDWLTVWLFHSLTTLLGYIDRLAASVTLCVCPLSKITSHKQPVADCGLLVFTARCYASAVLAMALCPSVCLSVCPSQVGVLLKRLNIGSHKQHHTIPQGV